MSNRAPLEIVNEYYEYVWTGRDVERIRSLCANPMLRHDPGGDIQLTHDQQIERITAALKKELQYHFVLKYGNDELVTLVWQAVSKNSPDLHLAGVQVVRVAGGRMAEVWNATKPELWVPQQA
ncbi:MAG: nuclear transport factor 2 family protein [Porticoccaceae bacterium]